MSPADRPRVPVPDPVERRIGELESALAREQAISLETRTALERVTDGFFSLNDLWQYTYVSPRAGELLGRKPEELLGKHLWTEFPGGVGQRSHHAYYKSLAEQTPLVVEEYFPPRDRWYEHRIYPSPNGLSVFFSDVTERRKSLENRVRLGAVMEAILDLVGFADAGGRILHLNPAGRRMLGLGEAQETPGALIEYFPERLRNRYADEWLPGAEAEGHWHGEAALQTRGGPEIPVWLALSVHRKPDGGTEFLSIIAHDLSRQKEQESQLRQREIQYRTIIDNAPEAIVVLDLESGRFSDCNENALRLFALPRESLLELGPVALSPPTQPDGRSSSQAAREYLENAVQGGRPIFEWTHRSSRGVDFPCEIRLVRIPSDRSVLVRGSIIDISERKRAEELRRESEARFRQIAETIRDAFWIAAPDLKEYLYVSPAFEEIWGRDRREIYRSPESWNESVHPDDGGPALRTPSGNGRMDNTYRIIRPDGKIRWIRERGFPVVDPGGRPVRMVGIAEDVTDLKETERELLESRRRLEEALERTQDRVVQLEEQVRGRGRLGPLVGKSPVMQTIYQRIRLAGQSPVNVLITGESGTGKEMTARAIHEQGVRKNGPFIAVNCSAIPAELLESELFGHVKGAFTGAVRDKTGLFQSAEGGILFLDEVGDMPAGLQVKVLRALQEREIRRVGDEVPLRIDVQLVTATNRDLARLIHSGAMRSDFYYRIRVFEIHLAPLRDRKDDIPLLVSHFMEEFSVSKRKKIRGISAEAMRFLMNHPWPGNIRELRNALEHAFVTVTGDSIRISDFPPALESTAPEALEDGGDANEPPNAERERIVEALRKCEGHRGKAAKVLGYSRVTLWKYMRRFGL